MSHELKFETGMFVAFTYSGRALAMSGAVTVSLHRGTDPVSPVGRVAYFP